MSKNDKPKGLYSAVDIRKDVMELYDGHKYQRLTTGFRDLDPLLRIIKPSFYVWTGTPNSGKSSLIFDIMVRVSKLHKFKWAVFSPEHSLAGTLTILIEKFCQKPFDPMFDNRVSVDETLEAIDFINEHFYFIDGVGDTPTIDYILERAKYCADEYKIDGLVLDPYNEINSMRTNLREDEHISMLISKIKRFNKENDIVSFLVAHPTKQIRQPDGQFRVDSLYAISGSAHFNNKCEAGIIVSRDFEKGETTIRVAKIRNIEIMGNIGECKVKWNSDTRCFHDIESMITNNDNSF